MRPRPQRQLRENVKSGAVSAEVQIGSDSPRPPGLAAIQAAPFDRSREFLGEDGTKALEGYVARRPAVDDVAQIDLIVIAKVGDDGPPKINEFRPGEEHERDATKPVMRDDEDTDLFAFSRDQRLERVDHPGSLRL